MSTPPLTPSRALGTTGVLVSPLCFGGNVFGWTVDRDDSFTLLDEYVAQGGNFIDTADVYSEWIPGNSGGDSERIMGEWLRTRGNRADVVIATKVAKLTARRGLAPDNIRAALDDSLQRLETDYIDLYYAHEDDENVPMLEYLQAFDEAVRSGKVRHLGASNFSPARLSEALRLQREHGLAPFVAIQDLYNLVERRAYEENLAPLVAEYQMSVLPYYSLAKGFLTGKYRPGVEVESARAKGAMVYLDERGERVLAALDQVAAAHSCPVGAVSLAWLLTRPGVAAPIASARTPEQLADLLPMATITLRPDEIALLDDASA
jgi:aryl-alcohol dehydrogenase-like predicted oxidoreductase